MATRRIQEFLDGNKVRYVVVRHSPAYTAAEVAESAHVRGAQLAKVVVVNVDGSLALAVVPSTRDVGLDLLRDQLLATRVRLAEEAEFRDRFEGCQLGAVPPFGNLFGVDTFVDPSLTRQEQIAFSAGTHVDVIVMRVEDYLRLARPVLMHVDAALAELKAYSSTN